MWNKRRSLACIACWFTIASDNAQQKQICRLSNCFFPFIAHRLVAYLVKLNKNDNQNKIATNPSGKKTQTEYEIKLYQIDAFTSQVFSGNPAAVCPLEGWLEDIQLQNIAAENNLAETAFYVKTKDGYHIRWLLLWRRLFVRSCHPGRGPRDF